MRVLKIGSSGDDVRQLQTMLNLAGFRTDIDGKFTSQTESAVRGFQAAHKLVIDGVVGDQTWNALFSATTYGQVAPYTTELPIIAPPTTSNLPQVGVTGGNVYVPGVASKTITNMGQGVLSNYTFYIYIAGAALLSYLVLTMLPSKEK